MKRILVAVSAMTCLMSGMAYAQQVNRPGIDDRQTKQQQRIDQGIASGQLNEEEAARMKKEQADIANMESAAKADGVVTKEERGKIQAAQDRASRNIAREKHDRLGIDDRQTKQQQRIDQGIASGQLNEEEAARMKKEQADIANMESAAKADGVVTKEERGKIQAAQDRASRNIAREKHDRQAKQ